MKELFAGLLIVFIIGIMSGYITYSDCSECAEDYPFKDYSVIQFYNSPTGFPVYSFTFSLQKDKEVYNEKDTTNTQSNI